LDNFSYKVQSGKFYQHKDVANLSLIDQWT